MDKIEKIREMIRELVRVFAYIERAVFSNSNCPEVLASYNTVANSCGGTTQFTKTLMTHAPTSMNA